MKKVRVNPLRLFFIGTAIIMIASIAKIMHGLYYSSLFITGLSIEFISIFLLLKRLDISIRKSNSKLKE